MIVIEVKALLYVPLLAKTGEKKNQKKTTDTDL